ncbi:hypothetical protein BJ741DRAFT_605266 [Chytriomyces cf. hyalinus JEL632]|nr:hypothetical protein BJ741DRAFT_605266 [Chytriomyces cf. hyalinus JEL632]
MNMTHSKSAGPVATSSSRSKSISRSPCSKQRSRQRSNTNPPAVTMTPEGFNSAQAPLPHILIKPTPPRKSSLQAPAPASAATLTPASANRNPAAATHTRTPSQTEFQLLPIAPAAFERRRPSLPPSPSTPSIFLTSASSIATEDDLVSPSSPGTPTSMTASMTNQSTWAGHRRKSSLSSVSSGVNMSRRSYSSFEKVQRRAEADMKGVYGWTEEEAAHYNQEYVAFMKSKGVNIAV